MLHAFRRSFLFALFGVVLLGLAGCGDIQHPAATTEAPAAAPAATTQAVASPAAARYECPMGCEGSQSSQPGQCPVCGMELEKQS